MSRKLNKPLLAVGVVLLAVVAVFLSFGLDAQEDAVAEVLVGTYEPQQVAQAAGLQEQVMQQMSGLQQRAQEAQQAGDEAAMQQIQAEAQQIQQEAADRFIADLEAVMPQVAAATGATIIATDVTYAAPGVVTEDVTQAVVEAMQGTAAPGAR